MAGVENVVMRGAFLGAIAGAAIELLNNGRLKGEAILTSTIASAALSAVSFYFGATTACFTALGLAAGYACTRDEGFSSESVIQALGATILGAVIGYSLELSGIQFTPIIIL